MVEGSARLGTTDLSHTRKGWVVLMCPDVTLHGGFNASPRVERPEAHNASVDETRLQAGACARVHLPTGRICTLRHGHAGSCDFVAPDQVDESLARRQAAEGW